MSWFFARLRRYVPISPFRTPGEAPRVVGAALLAGAAALGVGLAVNALLPAGLAFPFVAAGMAAALALYVAVVLGVRPTPAGLRALLADAAASGDATGPGAYN
jgi:hypothetical protein